MNETAQQIESYVRSLETNRPKKQVDKKTYLTHVRYLLTKLKETEDERIQGS